MDNAEGRLPHGGRGLKPEIARIAALRPGVASRTGGAD